MKKITKTGPPPLPTQVSLLAEAAQCDNEDAARLLIDRALGIIYGDREINPNETDAAIALIRSLGPQDTTELHLAAQFVALNLHGMAMLTSNYLNSKGQAMMMIRLSHHALDMLMRYRGKSPINVLNEGGAVMNTLIQSGDK